MNSHQTCCMIACTMRKFAVLSKHFRTLTLPPRLHHTRLPAYMKEMKKYHLAHHYKNFDLGFGVTSKVWDYVFNTVIPL